MVELGLPVIGVFGAMCKIYELNPWHARKKKSEPKEKEVWLRILN